LKKLLVKLWRQIKNEGNFKFSYWFDVSSSKPSTQ
jgi:hypothetical protein